jgi:UDP-glucose:(heptosyl)LPS alpha-1,3-glucosyltransferase
VKAALAIFRLQPAGGLEQHALRLAEALAARGWATTLVTTVAPARPPAGVAVRVIQARGHSNHGRLAAFAADARAEVAGADRAVAFHAIPGFDWVFLADPSRARPSWWRGLLPRYATYARLERAAFAPPSPTRVLCLSTAQLEGVAANDGTERKRLVRLPPTLDPPIATEADITPGAKAAARAALGVPADGPLWLWVGLQPNTKGLDRALAALALSPNARLLVCGLGAEAVNGAKPPRVSWLGLQPAEGVRQAMIAADLLVHPARADVTGGVILEAMAQGLPVVVTDVCGFAEHVRAANAGVVLPAPLGPTDLSRALAGITPAQLAAWSANALTYARQPGLFSGLAHAVDLIVRG